MPEYNVVIPYYYEFRIESEEPLDKDEILERCANMEGKIICSSYDEAEIIYQSNVP